MCFQLIESRGELNMSQDVLFPSCCFFSGHLCFPSCVLSLYVLKRIHYTLLMSHEWISCQAPTQNASAWLMPFRSQVSDFVGIKSAVKYKDRRPSLCASSAMLTASRAFNSGRCFESAGVRFDRPQPSFKGLVHKYVCAVLGSECCVLLFYFGDVAFLSPSSEVSLPSSIGIVSALIH